MEGKRVFSNTKCILLFINFSFCLVLGVEMSSLDALKNSKRYLLSTKYIENDFKNIEKQEYESNPLKSNHILSSFRVVKTLGLKQESSFRHKKKLNLLNEWNHGKYERNDINPAEKESEIAEIFFGVAYGTPTLQTFATSQTASEHSEAQKVRRMKKYFPLIRPTTSYHQHNFIQNIYHRKPNSRNSYLVQESKVMKEKSNSFRHHSQNLIKETNDAKLNFSLPQLFISTEEMYSKENENLPHSTKSSVLEENLSKVYIGSEMNLDDNEANVINTVENDMDPIMNETINSNFTSSRSDFNYWTQTRNYYSTAWSYHDIVVLTLFSLLSILPLIILTKLHFIKRDHITPRYCSLLTFYLLVVCITRIILYSIDPHATKSRISFMIVSFINFSVQSLLICSVGIFLVVLIFPIYRPKSQLLPRLINGFLLTILISKFILYFLCIMEKKTELFFYIKPFVCLFNLSEIGVLSIFYIFLNLCTRQKHKIWWIRVYKKTLTTSTNYSFSLLYSKLRKSIRLGSFAVFVQLVNSILYFIIEFDLREVFSTYQTDAWMIWVEESFKKIFEGFVCVSLILGVNLLFVPKMRTVIKKRGSFRTFIDIIKGRRRKKSKGVEGKGKQNLSIFTLNKHKKTDYATTDFQLVWNQGRNFPMTNIAGTDRQKSTKSLDFAESSLTTNDKKGETKLSRSVDVLNNINEPKPQIPFQLYDNLPQRSGRTPIYQNQYIHYDYIAPKIHDPNICPSHNGKSIQNNTENRRKGRKNSRPKSYAEEKPKINENYLTSYFSVLSMDRFADVNMKEYTTQNENQMSVVRKPTPFSIEEINSPMISNEKWKDIKITQKFCTIKINPRTSRKKLSTSKSIDLF